MSGSERAQALDAAIADVWQHYRHGSEDAFRDAMRRLTTVAREAPAEGVSPQPDWPEVHYKPVRNVIMTRSESGAPLVVGHYPPVLATPHSVVQAVEPTPEPPTLIGVDMASGKDQTVYRAPTGAPAPCVWRPVREGSAWLKPTCRDFALSFLPAKAHEFAGCPYCLKPLTVER